ncbi:hypothetical protein [Bradyrhizobium sp. C9]|uniref:hypothetical protein n=1 Tax=Bradyrhizobium sp. C9 TaxID=142585 RepID=UPI0011778C15|nr:hypothetical protein [Bradyrhizobium sp. C9]
MKRLSLVALLLAGSVAAAHADNDIYTNMSKQKRGNDALHADAAVCAPLSLEVRASEPRRIDGPTVAMHPSRRRFAAPQDDGVREKQSARWGRPPGAELMPVECFRTRRE